MKSSTMKNAAQVLAIGGALMLGIALATPAEAASSTYDRAAAATYAQKYSCNQNTSCRNSNFVSFEHGDCTNFVSQALWAGGKKNVQGSNPQWFWLTKTNYSQSFVQVPKLKEFLGASSRSVTWKVKMGAQFTSASKGDLYLYDWGKGEGWSHLSMETGYGAFANIVDNKTGRNYRTVTSGKGDFVAQHTTDRDGSPWNWGYQTEKDAKVKKKMRTVIIHVSDKL